MPIKRKRTEFRSVCGKVLLNTKKIKTFFSPFACACIYVWKFLFNLTNRRKKNIFILLFIFFRSRCRSRAHSIVCVFLLVNFFSSSVQQIWCGSSPRPNHMHREKKLFFFKLYNSKKEKSLSEIERKIRKSQDNSDNNNKIQSNTNKISNSNRNTRQKRKKS